MSLIPNIFSPGYWKKTWQEIQMVWYVVNDSRVPLYLKVLPAIVVIYLLSPLDLVPGFLPIVGQLDDFGLLLLALKGFVRLAPAEVIEEYKIRQGLPRVASGA